MLYCEPPKDTLPFFKMGGSSDGEHCGIELWGRRSALAHRGGRVKREGVGALPAWGEGCSVVVFPAVAFRSQTGGELLPQMREWFPYADENIGLAMQKASTFALCPHAVSHCYQKTPWSQWLFLEETTPVKQEWSVQAHVSVYVGRVGCPSGMNVLLQL